MALKITEVKVETVLTMFEWTFVRVYAGDLYRTGEAGPSPALKGSEALLRKLLVGEDPMKINRIEEKLRHASLYAGTSFFHIISAVNIALLDLVSKWVNLLLWRFLGATEKKCAYTLTLTPVPD